MTRTQLTVLKLATETGVDVETVRFFLADAEIPYRGETGVIPRNKAREARAALGLPSSKQLRSIGYLAREAGLKEHEARQILLDADVLDQGAVYINRGRLTKARKILGVQPVLEKARFPEDSIQEQETPAGREIIWRVIGTPCEVTHLEVDDVILIHRTLTRDFKNSDDPIYPPGIKSQPLLESAVHRPRTGLGDEQKYPTCSMAAAALFHALVHDHPFHNGNKRAAVVALLQMLDRNNLVVEANQDSLYDFALTVARHDLLLNAEPKEITDYEAETVEMARWIQRNSRAVRKEEYLLKFHELRNILTGFGCNLSAPRGNKVLITRDIGTSRLGFFRRKKLRATIHYSGDGREVDGQTIKGLRSALELDEQNGVDSEIFYRAKPTLDEFILKYRRTLSRLARI